ncbi:MAG: S9 family peptidase [Sinobacteraceae bacterium]|nr:S9 family peptidase [Nevskiaceae bacterium]MCP5338629.1 S9 family peptidase [Nevskiaceae bacterium]MCP5466692.1 S9 family peptidase [Nevskiaceae bacterium]
MHSPIIARPLHALLTVLLATTAAFAAGAAPAAEAAGTPTRVERGNLILDGVPDPDPVLAAKLDDWLAGRGATFRDFLPDGGLLISTRFGDVEQLHRVATPLGAREQLTFFAEPVGSARVAPGGEAAIAFLKDRGGDENAQVHLYRPADRRVLRLSDGRSLHGGLAWSPDGRRLAFHGNARNGVDYDIYVADVAAAGAAATSPGPDAASTVTPLLAIAALNRQLRPIEWSPDGTRLLLRQDISVNDSHLFVADPTGGTLTQLPTNTGPDGRPSRDSVAIGAAHFSADGSGVWFVSDLGGEFARILYLDLASGTSREPFTGAAQWDVEDLQVSADGRWLAWVTNVDGLSQLTLYDLGARRELRPTGLPQGVISNLRFDRSGRRLGMTIDGPQAPRDAFVFELERSELVRWTHSEAGPLDPARFVPVQLVRYPTWDHSGGQARQIPAWVWRPRTPGPHPVLIDIHGGPEAQARPTFSAFTQFLVNELGYAVVQPNVRGSTGYGRSYTRLDNGALRGDAVRDIGSLLVWIAAQRDFDSQRVVVAGGSYGGFMSLASMVNYGDRLRGGVSVVGISNFVSFLQNTSAYRRDLRRAEYGDEREPRMRAQLQRISPLTNAAMIRKPLLVVQGLNDPRVPASESEQIVQKLRANRGEAWYLAARDEGHGFRKKPNRDFYLKTFASFLARLKE